MKPAIRAKLYLLKQHKEGEFTQSFVLGFATVCLGIRRDALFIASIHVHRLDRGKGHGQRALEEVLRVCDKYGCACSLEVRPFSGNRSENRLRLWYEKHGFYATRGQYMKRQPRRVK
jgi:ribosomal protein S18 acetylase RimI-like enzyme